MWGARNSDFARSMQEKKKNLQKIVDQVGCMAAELQGIRGFVIGGSESPKIPEEQTEISSTLTSEAHHRILGNSSDIGSHHAHAHRQFQSALGIPNSGKQYHSVERTYVQNLRKDSFLGLETNHRISYTEKGKLAEEDPKKCIEELVKHLLSRDEEISKLNNDIQQVSTHLNEKVLELQCQVAMQRKVNREFKKRIVQLESSLEESRRVIQKMRKVISKQDKPQKGYETQSEVHKSSGVSQVLNIQTLISFSMVVLVIFVRR